MDLSLILKIAGVGIVCAVAAQIVSKTGKDDVSSYISIAGIITVVLILLGEIDGLIASLKNVFGI